MFASDAVEELMLHGILHCDSFVRIQCEQSVEEIVEHVIVSFSR
jgi:hypothetical protein